MCAWGRGGGICFFFSFFEFEFPIADAPRWLVLYQGRAVKRLARDVFDLLPYIRALLMTSPKQTAGHSHGYVIATSKW